MADIDFYGYERDHAGTYLYSSDVAAIYFDNNGIGTPNRAGLVQNVQAAYQHSVLPRFEAGSSELFWVTGQAQGSVAMGRLVAYNGLLDGLNPGTGQTDLRNGILGGVNIKIGKLAGALRSVNIPQSQLIMAGCVLQGYSCSFTTGALEVSEMTAISVAFMKRTKAGGSVNYGGSVINGATGGGGVGGGLNAGANALGAVADVAAAGAGLSQAAANLASVVNNQ